MYVVSSSIEIRGIKPAIEFFVLLSRLKLATLAAMRWLLFGFLLYSTFLAADVPFSKISRIELRPFFKRTFKQPVYVTPYPGKVKDCPDAYAVVEKPGVIRLESPEKRCDIVLADLSERVADPTLEEGLLGLAFSPDFRNSGTYFAYYSAAKP